MFDFNKSKENTEKNRLTIPLLPLRDVVVFPHMIVPLFVGREKSINALESAMRHEKGIFLTAQKSAEIDEPMEDDIYTVGTIGNIIQLLRLPDGTVKALVEGVERGVIKSYIPSEDFFLVDVEELGEGYSTESDTKMEALTRNIAEAFTKYAKLSRKVSPEMMGPMSSVDDPAKFAYTVAAHLHVKQDERQKVLETTNIVERLEKIYALLMAEIEILEVEGRIRKRVKTQMEKTQKDYYLNEQMRAIQKEMGEEDSFKGEIKELEKKLKEKKLSEEAHQKVEQEMKKLKMMSPMSAEATVIRNYIDWIFALPWYEKTEDKKNLKESEMILEEDHYGLKKVKERILEYLAVQILSKKKKVPYSVSSVLLVWGKPP